MEIYCDTTLYFSALRYVMIVQIKRTPLALNFNYIYVLFMGRHHVMWTYVLMER